ncbi:hypothetical protein DSM16313_03240 [Acinetobacter seohaensis]|nr:hypothetical protein DSM16313_03240 [Acinetobacter seohaensis]
MFSHLYGKGIQLNETHRKNKATTIKLVAAFPPILSYDEWEAIAVPHQQQLVDDTRN